MSEKVNNPIYLLHDQLQAQAIDKEAAQKLRWQIEECLHEYFKWNKGDPRNSINKRANIFILRPASSGYHWETGIGNVETKNGWSIWTSFAGHSSIDNWDEDWLWSWAPKFPIEIKSVK